MSMWFIFMSKLVSRARKWQRPVRLLGVLGFALSDPALAANGVESQTVNVYGLLDISERFDTATAGQKTDKETRRPSVLQTSGMSNSYLGIQGREAASDPHRVVFALESGLAVNTGSSSQRTAFFDRRAFIGLEGVDGEALHIGRNTTFAYDLAACGVLDPLQRAYNSVNQPATALTTSPSGAIGKALPARLNPANTLVSGALALDRNNGLVKYRHNLGNWSVGLARMVSSTSTAMRPRATEGMVAYTDATVSLAVTRHVNVDDSGHRLQFEGMGARWQVGEIQYQVATLRVQADDAFRAGGVHALDSADNGNALALPRAQGLPVARDRMRVDDVAVTLQPSPRWSTTVALYRLSVAGDGLDRGHTDTLVGIARYQLGRQTQLYSGVDVASAHGALHGVHTPGHNLGATLGMQLRF